MAPIDWMSGSLSGRQVLDYGAGGTAYDAISLGDKASPTDYQPKLITKYNRLHQRRFFCVRVHHTVNMSAAARTNWALLGGSGAIMAALLRNKSAQIYSDCLNAAKEHRTTLRAYIVPLLREGLRLKSADITIAEGVSIVNPWISEESPNVPVSQRILDKFASVLSNI